MIRPLLKKYHDLYWAMAYAAATKSKANKRKVGAVLVMPTGMISPGWNGTPPGFSNKCEDQHGDTLPEVIHAERNAIDKMTRQGISTDGAYLFTTYAPCFECAKAIQGLGLAAIFYDEIGNNRSGIELLHRSGVQCLQTPQYNKEIVCPIEFVEDAV